MTQIRFLECPGLFTGFASHWQACREDQRQQAELSKIAKFLDGCPRSKKAPSAEVHNVDPCDPAMWR